MYFIKISIKLTLCKFQCTIFNFDIVLKPKLVLLIGVINVTPSKFLARLPSVLAVWIFADAWSALRYPASRGSRRTNRSLAGWMEIAWMTEDRPRVIRRGRMSGGDPVCVIENDRASLMNQAPRDSTIGRSLQGDRRWGIIHSPRRICTRLGAEKVRRRQEGRRRTATERDEKEKEIAKWKVAGHRYQRGTKNAPPRGAICKRRFKTGYLRSMSSIRRYYLDFTVFTMCHSSMPQQNRRYIRLTHLGLPECP